MDFFIQVYNKINMMKNYKKLIKRTYFEHKIMIKSNKYYIHTHLYRLKIMFNLILLQSLYIK